MTEAVGIKEVGSLDAGHYTLGPEVFVVRRYVPTFAEGTVHARIAAIFDRELENAWADHETSYYCKWLEDLRAEALAALS